MNFIQKFLSKIGVTTDYTDMIENPWKIGMLPDNKVFVTDENTCICGIVEMHCRQSDNGACEWYMRETAGSTYRHIDKKDISAAGRYASITAEQYKKFRKLAGKRIPSDLPADKVELFENMLCFKEFDITNSLHNRMPVHEVSNGNNSIIYMMYMIPANSTVCKRNGHIYTNAARIVALNDKVFINGYNDKTAAYFNRIDDVWYFIWKEVHGLCSSAKASYIMDFSWKTKGLTTEQKQKIFDEGVVYQNMACKDFTDLVDITERMLSDKPLLAYES